MKFYLTASTTTNNIYNILDSSIITHKGSSAITDYQNNSEYLYFELVFPELKRNDPGIGIYLDYNILKDYDFYYFSDKGNKIKFPKKNIYKRLEQIEEKYLKKRNKLWSETGEWLNDGYYFITKSPVVIEKNIRFISKPNTKKDEKKLKKILKNKYPKAKMLVKDDRLDYSTIPKNPEFEKKIKKMEK